VPQGSTLGSHFFSTSINDLCAKIHSSNFFPGVLKIFHVMESAEDCKLLQSDIDSVQGWCTGNYMKIKIHKTNIIYFTCKSISLNINYYIGDILIIHTDCVKDLGIMLDIELYFHHVDPHIFLCIEVARTHSFNYI
jgi:hypothetical protein